MVTFVLVHGAWSGAHDLRRVRGPLRAAGHEVFTPSLTGIGERVHLASPQVCLTTHITDLVNTIRYEDLHDIVLLGWSYGGFVISGAMEYIGDRVKHLVFLDAFVPRDGEAADDSVPNGPGRLLELGDSWLLQAPLREFEDPELGAWVTARRTPQPRGTFAEPIRLVRPIEDYACTRTFIKATGDPRTDPPGPFWRSADRVRDSPAWRYREIDTNHMVPINRPDELARLLLELT